VLLATAKCGAGLTTDSIYYFDAARNLAAGKGYVFHTGEPLIWWPPLYPMLLALVGIVTGLDPAVFAHVVNAVLFGLAICLSARLFRAGLRYDNTYGLLGVCGVLFSLPLSGVYRMAWSECLFIPLVLLYLVSAERYSDTGGRSALAVMTLATVLACLTRYIGVALVVVGTLTILLTRRTSTKTRITSAILFASLSLAPLGFWMARNFRLAGTLSGDRFHSVFRFAHSVISFVMTVLSWYEPVGLAVKLGSVPGTQAAASAVTSANLFVALVGILVLVAVLLLFPPVRRRVLGRLRTAFSDHKPAVLFLVVYSGVLLAVAVWGASSSIDSRLASPVYVPLTLVLVSVFRGPPGPSRPAPKAVGTRLPTLLLALWLCLLFANAVRWTAARYKEGAGGYSTRAWRESETIAYAKRVLADCDGTQVFSNGPDGLWELARVNACWIPSRAEVNLNDLEGSWPPEDTSVIVWLKNVYWRTDLFSIEEIEKISDVQEVAQFSDGAVYRVSVRDTAELTREGAGRETDAVPQR